MQGVFKFVRSEYVLEICSATENGNKKEGHYDNGRPVKTCVIPFCLYINWIDITVSNKVGDFRHNPSNFIIRKIEIWFWRYKIVEFGRMEKTFET